MKFAEPIAIVGIGGIFPGSPTLEAYWENVVNGVSAAREVPEGRWSLAAEDAYDPATGAPDKVYSKRGCYVEGFKWDPRDLAISREFVNKLDPMFHLLLHAGRQAFESASMQDVDRSRVGVIIGNIALPTESSSGLNDEVFGPLFEKALFGESVSESADRIEPLNRYVAGLPGGVLAKALGLGGGSYTLDAACASSLYAVKLACDELLAGRSDAMLTGGLSRPDCQYTQMGFAQLRALSASGQCSPFDAKGDGLVVGEGSGIVVLKRLSDALTAGDEIHAVIKGVGLSNDVEGNLLAPASEGQLRAMRAAYEEAEWTPEMVDMIECHATGTPIGDAVEFNSLKELWGERRLENRKCVLGAAKANVGHLLTGAGAAGLIRVLLAMKNRTLPPIANFVNSSEKVDFDSSPFTALTEGRPWELRDDRTPRRAAVSAFGFGGINAHVLIEEWTANSQSQISNLKSDIQTHEAVPIAIVGMDACFGQWTDLRKFQERVLGGDKGATPTFKRDWWGAENSDLADGGIAGHYLDDLRIPIDRFRIPPKELEETLPQQLLMLQVAAGALKDAACANLDGLKTGAFIGIELDMETNHFHFRWSLLNRARAWAKARNLDFSEKEFERWVDALRESSGPALNANRTMGALGGIVASRLAREFRIGGPSHTISCEEASGMRALEAAVRALQQGELDHALVGAVDLSGDVRAALAVDSGRAYSRNGEARPFSRDTEGAIPGEGAAALVLKRLDDAIKDGNRVYSVIRGTGAASGGGVDEFIPDSEACKEAMRRAYLDARVDPASVDYLETHGSGNAAEDAAEARAIANFFGEGERTRALKLGSAKERVGHAGAASALASVVKASLGLYQEMIPGLKSSGSPLEEIAGSPAKFALPDASQCWLRDRVEGPRRAGVTAFGVGGTCVHVVLEALEEQNSKVTIAERLQPLGVQDEALFLIDGQDNQSLRADLSELEKLAESWQDRSIVAIARQWWNRGAPKSRAQNLALVARDGNELFRLCREAGQTISKDNPAGGNGRKTAVGDERIFFSNEPVGRDGKVAFVYPGSGNHYPDMGREIGVAWPELLRRQDGENERLASQVVSEMFWNGASPEAIAADHHAMIFGQVAHGTLVSDLIQACGVNPDEVIGYSLGESAGLFSTRAWTARDEMYRRMIGGDLFTRQLAGACESARKTWNLAQGEEVDWSMGVVDRTADETRAALEGRERVYLLIVNTPRECIVGGQRAAVDSFVADLGCHYFPIEGVTTVHCEVAKPVADVYRSLHLFETNPPPGVRYYSGNQGKDYELTCESAADSIVGNAVHGLDYPATINSAYDNGARIFIEMGPGATCCRMIDQILGGRSHAATSVSIPGQDATVVALRALGRLFAEGVSVNLDFLYGGDRAAVGYREPDKGGKASDVLAPLGGKPFDPPRSETFMNSRPEATPSSATVKPSLPTIQVAQSIPAINAKADSVSVPAAAQMKTAALARSGSLVDHLASAESARIEAHETYLRFSANLFQTMSLNVERQTQLLSSMEASGITIPGAPALPPSLDGMPQVSTESQPAFEEYPDEVPRQLNFAQCMEFAIGKIGKVMGKKFVEVDSHPTRVRLPDDPLMLAHRVLEIEGEPLSMTSGRVVTEHDIHPGAWYLDAGRIPTCIAVEAGQADLFLSGFLGIDFETKGLAVYRLLDAVVTFHRGLPVEGETIHYDIRIEEFFRQGSTWLFRFGFDGTVNGERLLTMRKGIAGFFSQAELDAGKGIVHTKLDLQEIPGILPDDWAPFVPWDEIEAYTDEQLNALRQGNLAGCFGERFAGLPLNDPLTLPDGRMRLVHRITELDPTGGRFGIGRITGEADIHPDDWFLTCHFSDDMVMPGTLMFECCLHTLRVFLLRLGWVFERSTVAPEPVTEIKSQLKCRGQVMQSTKKVTYVISIKELGYRPEPYAVVDALMYSDDKATVEITNMSIRFTGATKESLQETWDDRGKGNTSPTAPAVVPKSPLYDFDSIHAFAVGNPSDAFGDRYKVFDNDRRIARLPGPPYQFLDRITEISNCEPWVLDSGGVIEAQYGVPVDEWYFAQNRQGDMPFSVLLEIALQPCGWLAAYLGSALTSETDLRFRNLGGSATQFIPVTSDAGTLSVDVTITRVSNAGGMVIQNFDMAVRSSKGLVYQGDTYFGFFSADALATQVGIREAIPYEPSDDEMTRAKAFPYPTETPYPDEMLRMVDEVSCFVPDGGPAGLGFIRGKMTVKPESWFFKAHFYQDPVIPGSLGLESYLQLLKVVAVERWGVSEGIRLETIACGEKHEWVYRGQIIPTDAEVTVEAVITSIDDERKLLKADGFLHVDGRTIYGMKDFSLRVV
jgi:PfaB family protein